MSATGPAAAAAGTKRKRDTTRPAVPTRNVRHARTSRARATTLSESTPFVLLPEAVVKTVEEDAPVPVIPDRPDPVGVLLDDLHKSRNIWTLRMFLPSPYRIPEATSFSTKVVQLGAGISAEYVGLADIVAGPHMFLDTKFFRVVVPEKEITAKDDLEDDANPESLLDVKDEIARDLDFGEGQIGGAAGLSLVAPASSPRNPVVNARQALSDYLSAKSTSHLSGALAESVNVVIPSIPGLPPPSQTLLGTGRYQANRSDLLPGTDRTLQTHSEHTPPTNDATPGNECQTQPPVPPKSSSPALTTPLTAADILRTAGKTGSLLGGTYPSPLSSSLYSLPYPPRSTSVSLTSALPPSYSATPLSTTSNPPIHPSNDIRDPILSNLAISSTPMPHSEWTLQQWSQMNSFLHMVRERRETDPSSNAIPALASASHLAPADRMAALSTLETLVRREASGIASFSTLAGLAKQTGGAVAGAAASLSAERAGGVEATSIASARSVAAFSSSISLPQSSDQTPGSGSSEVSQQLFSALKPPVSLTVENPNASTKLDPRPQISSSALGAPLCSSINNASVPIGSTFLEQQTTGLPPGMIDKQRRKSRGISGAILDTDGRPTISLPNVRKSGAASIDSIRPPFPLLPDLNGDPSSASILSNLSNLEATAKSRPNRRRRNAPIIVFEFAEIPGRQFLFPKDALMEMTGPRFLHGQEVHDLTLAVYLPPYRGGRLQPMQGLVLYLRNVPPSLSHLLRDVAVEKNQALKKLDKKMTQVQLPGLTPAHYRDIQMGKDLAAAVGRPMGPPAPSRRKPAAAAADGAASGKQQRRGGSASTSTAAHRSESATPRDRVDSGAYSLTATGAGVVLGDLITHVSPVARDTAKSGESPILVLDGETTPGLQREGGGTQPMDVDSIPASQTRAPAVAADSSGATAGTTPVVLIDSEPPSEPVTVVSTASSSPVRTERKSKLSGADEVAATGDSIARPTVSPRPSARKSQQQTSPVAGARASATSAGLTGLSVAVSALTGSGSRRRPPTTSHSAPATPAVSTPPTPPTRRSPAQSTTTSPRTSGRVAAASAAASSSAASSSSSPTSSSFERRCLHCDGKDTPMWRRGPDGPKTLCNACGVKFMLGKLARNESGAWIEGKRRGAVLPSASAVSGGT
ncbi:hypothetical protein DFJ77DRAFT_450841 [Powellomyces hirtus]|nr:hypothetical protein DFJ77DRAFT_450841 [Powellomyces hirtus]